jgi:hypothetical protein
MYFRIFSEFHLAVSDMRGRTTDQMRQKGRIEIANVRFMFWLWVWMTRAHRLSPNNVRAERR